MYTFFTFITYKDKILYFDGRARNDPSIDYDHPDTIRKAFINAKDKGQHYAYKFANGRLTASAPKDDQAHQAIIKEWISTFAGSKEFLIICRAAIKSNPNNIKYIDKPKTELRVQALTAAPDLITTFNGVSLEEAKLALTLMPSLIMQLQDSYPELIKFALTQDASTINLIKNPSDDMLKIIKRRKK